MKRGRQLRVRCPRRSKIFHWERRPFFTFSPSRASVPPGLFRIRIFCSGSRNPKFAGKAAIKSRWPTNFIEWPELMSRQTNSAEFVCRDISSGHSIKFVGHLDLIAALPANFGLREPEQKIRILNNPGGTDARDGEKVKKGRLSQWKILDRLGQRTRSWRPRFIQLNQRRFNLCRIQRGSGFLFDPARAFHHAKDAAKPDEILLSIFLPRINGISSNRPFRAPGKGGGVQPWLNFGFRCAKFSQATDRFRVR